MTNSARVPHPVQPNASPLQKVTKFRNRQFIMDFRHFFPFTSIIRRNSRAEEPLDEYANQYLLSPSPYSGHFFDDMATSPRRGNRFRMSCNGVQDLDWPAPRTRGLPIDAVPTRSLGGYPLRIRFVDPLAGFGDRQAFHTREPERLPDRARFIDVLDEEGSPQISIEQRRRDSTCNEEPRSSLDFINHNYPERQRRPELRRTTISPRQSSSYRYGDSKPQERQLRSTARCMSTPRADGYQDWNPKSGAQKDRALPFGKAMQWLHEGLIGAEKFYKKFYDDYDREVKPIKYAGTDILQKLWVKKVMGKGAPGQGSSQEKRPAEKWEENFAEKKRSLREAMEAALNASLGLGDQGSPKPTTLKARKRLLEKVETAGQHVMDLLELATKGSEHCKALLGELKMLKDMVDPKKKENKSLYEGADGASAGDGGHDIGGSKDGGEYNNDEQHGWEQSSQDN